MYLLCVGVCTCGGVGDGPDGVAKDPADYPDTPVLPLSTTPSPPQQIKINSTRTNRRTHQVLVAEAGGVVKAIDGGEYKFDVSKSDIICGNAEVIPAVVEAIKAADRKMWKKVCVLLFV